VGLIYEPHQLKKIKKLKKLKEIIMITINTDYITNFSDQQKKHFYLITSVDGAVLFNLIGGRYQKAEKIILEDFSQLNTFLSEKLPDNSDILIIPYKVNQSTRVYSKAIQKDSRILSLYCYATHPDIDAIRHCLKNIYATDCIAQEKFSAEFFGILDRQTDNRLLIQNKKYNQAATFTVDQNTLFINRSGFIKDGTNLTGPGGEIAIGPKNGVTDLDGHTARLNVSGKLVLDGLPIVHRCSPEPFVTTRVLNNIFEKLKPITRRPILLSIDQGIITEVEALDGKQHTAVDVFNGLLTLDYRYENLTEVGCSFNLTHNLYDANDAFNEAYGGEKGCLHFGIGGCNNAYHIDFISPGSVLKAGNGEQLIG